MKNYFNSKTSKNINEWSSFCSSCLSNVQSLCSIGEPSCLDELIDKSQKELNVQKSIEESENIFRANNAIIYKEDNNKKPTLKNEKVKYSESLEKANTRICNTESILNRRKRILEIVQSMLNLSNYVDDMHTIILQGIYKKRTIEKHQKDVNKRLFDNKNALKNQALPIYTYSSLCVKKN